MRQLARDGITMVIVTYEMGFARDAATRMVFIDRGQVVETGTPAQFFSAPSTDRPRQFLQRCTAAGAATIAASYDGTMTEPSLAPGEIVLDAVVPPGRPWGHRVAQGDILRLIDLEGQQAADFLCYDVEDPTDRYCATNTIKVQGKLFVGKGTVLYSDLGKALFTVVEDTCGRHDTIYGCCSEPNNFLRYGIRGTHSCFGNFVEALAQFGLDRSYIVSNVNFFMSVPVAIDGAVVNIYGHSAAGNYVDLRAERDVLAVLSNCPQMHNPCNAYNLTPIRAIIWRPSRSGKP